MAASSIVRRTIPLWAKALMLASGYVVAAEIGNLLSIQHTFSTFWPPAGIFISMLLISERRDWPVLMAAGIAGNLVSDLVHDRALLMTVGFSIANALEALAGAALVRAFIGARPKLDSLRQVFFFAAVGAVSAPVVGASVGSLVVLSFFRDAVLWTTWYTWWIGDALGIVLVGSVVLTAIGRWDSDRDGPRPGRRSVLRQLARSAAVAVPFGILAYFVFAPLGGGTSWKFLVTPGIIACGIVGGPLGAAAGLLVIALGGILGTVTGAPSSHLAAAVDATRVLQAQAFFLVGGLTAMALAGVIAESRAFAETARNAAERFRLLFDTMQEGVAFCRMTYDDDGRPVDWVYLQTNEAYGRLTGVTDVVGKHIGELSPDLIDTNPEILETYGAVAATGEPAMFDVVPGGSDRTWRISVTSPARGDFLSVFEDVTERVKGERALAESNRRLEKMVYDVAAAMGSVVEARDPYTQGHEVRVAALARLIAREMGLREDELDGVGMAGLLHDIGKLRIPAEILTKPGVLSAAEFSLIREHPEAGYEILSHIEFPWPVADTVLQHHERLDGSGYPGGLRGDDIILPARILALADVVEAMASHRPYRAALGLDAAIAEIRGHGERYDGAVVAACVALYERGETGL